MTVFLTWLESGRYSEPRVTGGPPVGEIARQVVVGISEAFRSCDPDLFAADLIAKALEHAQLIVHAVHPLLAVRRFLDHDVAPLRSDDTLHGDLRDFVVLLLLVAP